MAAIPTIPEYFSEKNVFITGGSGFIGKVLIEKLLRSCPDIGKIYLLIRPKKGKNSQERIQFMTDLPLFDVLKKSFPENLAKIVPISGDVKELELGLSPQDKKTLIDEVHIVYHIAASVRFDDPLKDAVLMNTRGTREVARLAKEMKHLDVLMHFSTTYCNTDKQIIEEQIYPPHADWEKTIELAETLDAHVLDVLSVKYIHPLPNTYTFTKSLGEHVIADLCDGQVPSVIFRPSIVISTMTDPFSGWIDNFNGPVGILVASGKGVMRACYANKENIADYVPCDSVVKAVIMATWSKGLEKNESEKNKVSVYNASNYDVKQVTFGEIIDIGKQLTWEIPVNDVVWYPDGSIYSCWYAFYTIFIVYQLIPSLLLDALLLIMGYKPMFPSGAAFYGKLLDSKYNGPALYVIEQNMNLLCELNQNKPIGDLLLIDINGGEWFGTAGETSAVLLPEHAFYEAIPIDIGKGKIKKVSPSKEKLKKVSKQEKPPTRPQEELVTDKIKKLELKIFAKTKKTVSDLKFEESEWYQKYLDFKKKFEEIMGKVETDGEYSLDPSEKEWYEKYLDFRMKYLEIVEHRKNKLKNLSDYKLFELYNSDEFRNSCPPIPVFYPTEEVTEEDNPKPELSKPVHSKMFKSHS